MLRIRTTCDRGATGIGMSAKFATTEDTGRVTMDHYTHLDVMDLAGALEKLPALPGRKEDRAEEQNAA